jgi:uncharacterized repeat protein (TIGR01451 family)
MRSSAAHRHALVTVLVVLLAAMPLGVAAASDDDTVRIEGFLDHDRVTHHGHHEHGTTTTNYSIVDADGRSWELLVDPAVADPHRGEEVTLTGRPAGEGTLEVLAISGDAATHGAFQGSKRFATVLCKFADVSAEPQDQAFFEDMMGSGPDGLDHYWREVSYGLIDLDGSVTRNWLVLPDDRADYIDFDHEDNQGSDRSKLYNDCKGAHEADGFNFSGFFGINLIFNADLDCCAWGGGRDGFGVTWMPPWSWDTAVFAHEQGHAFGLPHSSGPYDATYDSSWDVMSGGPRPIPAHTIAYHKDLLGWVDHPRRFVWNGANNVQVTLDRLAMPPVPVNPAGANKLIAILPLPDGTFYTVEARRSVGYDANAPGEAVVIHHVDESRSDRQAQVVDADGNGNPNDDGAMWVPGEKFEDADRGVVVEVVTATSAGFVIVINPITVADLAVTKSAQPATLIAGRQVQYHLTATNHGPGTAQNVVLTDELPAGTTYVANTGHPGECSHAGGVVTCQLGQLKAERSRTIAILADVAPSLVANAGGPTTVTNTALVSQSEDIVDPDEENNVARLTSFVDDLSNLRARKDCKPDGPLSAGDTGTCTMWVDNLGPSWARSVQLDDEIISDGVFRVSAVRRAPAGPACSVLGSPGRKVDVRCGLGNLGVATSAAKVEVDVTADEGMDINNTATVSSATRDPDPDNTAASDSLHVRAESDLEITGVGPATVVAGESLTYLLTARNQGPSTAENVLVTDLLPAGVTVASISTTKGSCQAGEPGNAAKPTVCALGTLALNQSATISVSVDVLPSASGSLHNDAKVTSATHEPDNADNVTTWATTVQRQALLELTKTATPSPVVAGTVLSSVLTVANSGPSDAREVVIVDQLDSRVDFVSATISAAAGTCQRIVGGATDPGFGDAVRCQLSAPLPPGASVTIHIDVRVSSAVPEGGSVTDRATATSTTPGAPAVAEVVVPVLAEADLGVDMTVNYATGNASTTVVYTIVTTNHGPSDAQAVTLSDQLPSLLTNGGREKVELVFASAGCTYDAAIPHTVTCDLGTMRTGTSRTIELHIQLKGNGELENVVTVSSSTFDPNPANDSATDLSTVGGGNDKGGGGQGGWGRNK